MFLSFEIVFIYTRTRIAHIFIILLFTTLLRSKILEWISVEYIAYISKLYVEKFFSLPSVNKTH